MSVVSRASGFRRWGFQEVGRSPNQGPLYKDAVFFGGPTRRGPSFRELPMWGKHLEARTSGLVHKGCRTEP